VALVDLIYRMLEKDRNARIRSVRQVGLELEAIIQGEAIGTSLSSTIQVDARFAPALPATELPKHALPAQTTAFVGREAEMAELIRWLSTAPSRLLTILAPGGIGKTRLALEFSRRVLEAPPSRSGRSVRRFDDGIYFVPLASLSDSTQIIPAIADVIGCQLQPGGPEPAQQLLGYLRRKRMLLTLDNLEHLLDGIAFLAGILQAAPEVHILTTSREKLGLSDETVFALNSLTVQNWQTVEEALDFPAVQLFMQHARRSCPGFELTNENLDAVTRICQLVQGMPLGIILATGWLGLMSPQEIAAEITCSLDFLETEMRDVPERQRSIRAVFEQAWNLLNMQEQDVIQRLSVFRGGFTREAAQAVTGASLRTLASLTNKALLWRNPHAGRFEMHELLRHYAEELLEASDEADMARDAHSAYYAGILHWYEPVLHGRVPSDSTSLEAVRSAIQTGFQNTYAAAYPLADLLDPLTEREIEILELVSAGYSNRDIALKLVISVSTVKTHLNRAYNKLSVKSRTQAIRQAKALHILAS
jgi:predicted ATPase/DNA-binding CsgD family transcriptional regulator